MSAVSVLYTGNQGLYGRVQPITALPEIRVFRREGWEVELAMRAEQARLTRQWE